MEFDTALRLYLSGFRLPGESQKIDRFMEAFAKRFCACNPAIFSCTDGCYILAFATIMLNTSLHNPSVRDKPTLEIFMSMNRGIDNGKNINPTVLKELFESISRDQFKFPSDEGDLTVTFFNPEHQVLQAHVPRPIRPRPPPALIFLFFFDTSTPTPPASSLSSYRTRLSFLPGLA